MPNFWWIISTIEHICIVVPNDGKMIQLLMNYLKNLRYLYRYYTQPLSEAVGLGVLPPKWGGTNSSADICMGGQVFVVCMSGTCLVCLEHVWYLSGTFLVFGYLSSCQVLLFVFFSAFSKLFWISSSQVDLNNFKVPENIWTFEHLKVPENTKNLTSPEELPGMAEVIYIFFNT